MKIKFKANPDLLRVGDIGTCLDGADESLRRQLSIVILGALRARKIPFRNPNGIKLPPESLDITEKQTRDFVERPFLEKLGDFEGDLQRARETASAQPWIQQHYDLEAKLQAYAIEHEKYKEHIEPEIESEVNRLLDDWYRDGSVLVSEAAEWFCKEHDFERTSVESSSTGNGEIAQKLAKWFNKPIGDLPPEQRKLAEAYIPNWPELYGADRRALADEADRQLQARLGARFEKARMEVEQAHAATPARFAQRAMQDGFDKVIREKSGERNFEAKVAAVNLSHERCIELARKPELRIADWIELTGVGCGWCGAYHITSEGVSFGTWDEDHISSARLDWQIDMHRDNEQPPLKFPCTAIELLHFVDTARHDLYGFSVPDAFRQAITDIAPTTDTTQQVPAESQEQTGTAHSGASEVTPADGDAQADATTTAAPKKTAAVHSGTTKSASLLAKQTKLLKIINELESYAEGAKLPFDPKAMPGPLGDDWNEEGSFHWLCARLDRDFKKAKTTFEDYRKGICAVQKYAKRGDFYIHALPHIEPIFISKKKAGQEGKK